MQLQYLASVVALLSIGTSALPAPGITASDINNPHRRAEVAPPATEELWKYTPWDFTWDLSSKKHRRRAEVAPPATEELWKFTPWNFSWDMLAQKLRRRAAADTKREEAAGDIA